MNLYFLPKNETQPRVIIHPGMKQKLCRNTQKPKDLCRNTQKLADTPRMSADTPRTSADIPRGASADIPPRAADPGPGAGVTCLGEF